MPHDNLKTIYVTAAITKTLRRLAFEANCSMGDIVASLLDPRTPAQRAADEFAAEVRDTQESDRP